MRVKADNPVSVCVCVSKWEIFKCFSSFQYHQVVRISDGGFI